MKRIILAAGAMLMLSALLAGCGARAPSSERVTARVNVQPPWDAAANPFVVPGWKSGDQVSWQQQMTKRAQNQNEFLRVN